MANTNKTALNWEWPADRQAAEYIVVKLDRVEAASTGFFGFKKTPSIAGNLPNPIEISGVLIGQGETMRYTLTLPKTELGSLVVGDTVALGLIDKTCICVKLVPKALDGDALHDWLKGQHCE